MASLIEQINEMLKILEVVDPAGAKEFRGSDQADFMADLKPQVETQDLNASKLPGPKSAEQEPGGPGSAMMIPAQGTGTNPLNLNLTADSLIQGVIFSEILGKPISRRPRRTFL